MERYKRLLDYCNDSVVTRNASEKGLNAILDLVSSPSSAAAAARSGGGTGGAAGGGATAAATASFDLLTGFYRTTLAVLHEARSTRLWFKTSLKRAR